MTAEHRARLVKERARDLGFDAVGITTLDPVPHAAALTAWLDAGMAGTMAYLHRQAARRREPARIVPGATRAVVMAATYFQEDTPLRSGAGRVAKYARGRDYHDALKLPLEQLAAAVRALGHEGTIARPFVDAGPVPERELAQRAGLGWIGKNTMLIHPRHGSFFFLASVLTDLDLAVDRPFAVDRCGSCQRCLEACPTGAFPEVRVLDSRRCIAYLTIEYRGTIDPSVAPGVGSWVFGCDACQDVCPWNRKYAAAASDDLVDLRPTLQQLDLRELATITEEEFERRYADTPLQRAGASGMRRNAAVATANAEGVPPA